MVVLLRSLFTKKYCEIKKFYANPRSITNPIVQVAVLDIDICGPSIPKLMGCEGEQVHQSGSGWSPVVSNDLLSSSVLRGVVVSSATSG